VAAAIRPIFNADSDAQARALLAETVERLERPLPKVAQLLLDAEEDLLAFYAFPASHRSKLRSTDESVKCPAAPPGVESLRARVTPDRRAGRGDASPAAQDCRLTASEPLPGGGTRALRRRALAPVLGQLHVGELGLLAQGALARTHLLEVVGVGGAALAAA